MKGPRRGAPAVLLECASESPAVHGTVQMVDTHPLCPLEFQIQWVWVGLRVAFHMCSRVGLSKLWGALG